jgi:hypothetical protein
MQVNQRVGDAIANFARAAPLRADSLVKIKERAMGVTFENVMNGRQ